MSSKSTTNLLLTTVAGIIAGAFLGYYLPDAMLSISFFGQLFVNALRLVLIPVIIATVIVGVFAMADIKRVNRATGRTLLYFVSTSLIAVVVGLVLALVIQPGAGADITNAAAPVGINGVASVTPTGLISSIVPENLVAAVSQGQFLWLVLFSLIFGAILIPMGSKGKVIIDFFQGVNEVMMRLVQLLLYAAPVGLFSLVATAVASNTATVGQVAGPLGMFSLTVLIGFVIQAVVILPLALKYLGNRPVWSYFTATAPAMVTALGTSSPAAALPITYRCVTEEGKVDSRAGSLALPLGAMINMNGTAVYIVIAALFCAQAFNVDLSVIQIAIVALTALLVSIGASLIPNVSLLVLGVILYSADFPAAAYAGIGLILLVDWLFDRLRAVVNVWGDVIGAAVIGETFEFKTARRVTAAVSSRRGPVRKPQDRSKRKQTTRSKSPVKRQERPERTPKKQTRERTPRSGSESRKQPASRTRKQGQQRRSDGRPPQSTGRKPREEKSTPFVMPTPPYHVLETELKSRKPSRPKEPKPQEKELEKAIPAKSEVTAPSNETLERERARVAAQLEGLKERETPKRETQEQAPSQPEPEKREQPAPSDVSQPAYPKVDFNSDDDLAVAPATVDSQSSAADDSGTHREEPTAVTEKEKKPASESEPLQPVGFGRSKARRTPLPKPSSKENGTEKEKPEEPEFPAENISFGRGKRKKPSN